jgi:hypothetical protein
MSQVRVQWTPGPFVSRMRRGLANNLRDGIWEYRKAVVKAIRKQGRPGVHSKPGNPPFRQSGDLIKSYRTHTDRRALEAELFSDLIYAPILELRMNRPHLRRTLITERRALAAVFTRPV